MSATPLYFKNLDILRFLAAAMVLCTHTYGYVCDVYGTPMLFCKGYSHELNIVGQCVKTFFSNLSVGVDIFFIISGFLITSLLLHERENNGKIDLTKFYLRRILRIWPLYYLLLFVSYFFTRYYTLEPLPNYLAHAFFLGNFAIVQQNSFGTGKVFILWSICIEEHFYLFIPLILAYMPIRRIPYILLLVISISIGYRIFSVLHYTESWFRIYVHTLSRIDTIAIGALLAYIYRYHITHFSLPVVLRWVLLIAVLGILTFTETKNYNTVLMAGFFRYLYIIPIAILFVDFVSSLSMSINERRWKIINYLGKSSYSIYMWHVFTIVIIANVLDSISFLHQHRIAYFFTIITFTLGFAVFSYKYIESPFLRIQKRFKVL